MTKEYPKDVDKLLRILKDRDEYIAAASRIGNNLLEVNKMYKADNESLMKKLVRLIGVCVVIVVCVSRERRARL